MLGELESARVEGLSFVEFQVKIVKLVRHFIYQDYRKYPILKNFGIDEEEVELQVYHSLYNRKDLGVLSNMEKYFIKASSMNKDGKDCGNDTKYIVCLIKRVVKTSFCQLNRRLLRKNIEPDVLIGSLESDEFTRDFFDRGFGVEDTYDNLHYRDLLDQVPLVKYHYVVVVNDKKMTLTSRLLLDLIVSGYGRSELVKMIYDKETNKNIPVGTYAKIKSEVVELAKENLRGYIE